MTHFPEKSLRGLIQSLLMKNLSQVLKISVQTTTKSPLQLREAQWLRNVGLSNQRTIRGHFAQNTYSTGMSWPSGDAADAPQNITVSTFWVPWAAASVACAIEKNLQRTSKFSGLGTKCRLITSIWFFLSTCINCMCARQRMAAWPHVTCTHNLDIFFFFAKKRIVALSQSNYSSIRM